MSRGQSSRCPWDPKDTCSRNLQITLQLRSANFANIAPLRSSENSTHLGCVPGKLKQNLQGGVRGLQMFQVFPIRSPSPRPALPSRNVRGAQGQERKETKRIHFNNRLYFTQQIQNVIF